MDSSKSVNLGPTGLCLWVKTLLVQLSKWTAMQNILKIIILRTKILSSHRIHGLQSTNLHVHVYHILLTIYFNHYNQMGYIFVCTEIYQLSQNMNNAC